MTHSLNSMAQKSECIRYKPSLSFQNEPASFPVFPLEKGEFSETWKSLSPNISNQLSNPEDLFPYRSLTCPIYAYSGPLFCSNYINSPMRYYSRLLIGFWLPHLPLHICPDNISKIQILS